MRRRKRRRRTPDAGDCFRYPRLGDKGLKNERREDEGDGKNAVGGGQLAEKNAHASLIAGSELWKERGRSLGTCLWGATMCLTRRQRSFLLQVKGSNGKQLKLGSRGCLKGALTNTRRLH